MNKYKIVFGDSSSIFIVAEDCYDAVKFAAYNINSYILSCTYCGPYVESDENR